MQNFHDHKAKLERNKFPELMFTELHQDGVEKEQEISDHGLRQGDLCPKCKLERLDYDGLLNLSCARCGYALGGCFT